MLREGLHLFVLVTLITGTALLLWVRSEIGETAIPEFTKVLPPPPPGTPPGDCGPKPLDGKPIVIDMLYSVEKQAWIEEAATQFARRCPNIQVRLTAAADIASAEAILGDELAPTVWSPSDDIVVAYLEHRRQARNKPPVLTEERTSLLRTPLVILIWEERLRVYDEIRKRTAEGLWSQLLCALIPPDPPVDTVALEDRIPGLWSEWYDKIVLAPEREALRRTAANKPAPAARPSRPARQPEPPEPEPEPVLQYKAPFPSVDRIASWEYVQIGHSSPTHTTAGLETLYLMAFEHLLPPEARPAADAVDSDPFKEGPVHRSQHLADPLLAAYVDREEPLRRWFARCEGGLQGDPATTELLTNTMFHLGGELYDGIATYEHLVFPVLARLEGNAEVMQKMTVVYPPVTFVNQHPARILASASELQTVAARAWLRFLTGEAMQHRAIELGFRPANPDVKIREYHVDDNPFLRFRRFGVQFTSPIVEPPRLGGDRVNQLLELWRDATGRN